MKEVLEKKKQIVQEIAMKLKESKATVLVNYRGLNVAEITELRKQLREEGIDFKVYKNTMLRRATRETGIEGLEEQLVGPTAIAFSNEEVVAPAKIIHKFAGDHEALQIKAGIIEGEIADLDQINALAKLPPRDGLLSMICSVLQAPIRNFALAAKAVAEQKEESSPQGV